MHKLANKVVSIILVALNSKENEIVAYFGPLICLWHALVMCLMKRQQELMTYSLMQNIPNVDKTC